METIGSAAGPEAARPDESLVGATLAGDLDAFAELVDRHRDVVLRVTGRMVGSDEADDVTQDAFLRAFHRLPGFRAESPFRSWLLRIAHNAALDHLRRLPPEPMDPAALPDEGDVPSPRGPADRLELRERVDRLERKLRGLSAAHRAVLVLRDVEGLSYEEIAVICEMPVGSVKGRLHRARREFIAMLRTNTYDWELPE